MKAALSKNIRKLLNDKYFSNQLYESIEKLDNTSSIEFKVNDKTYILTEIK